MVGGLPFAGAGNFAPGAGSLAVRGRDLYVSSTCLGGVQRVPLRLLRDSRPADERAKEIDTVAKRKFPLESLKGITFNKWDEDDPWIYAGDPFRLQLIRIHSRTGRREVISNDHKRFNFTVSTAFLPPERRGGPTPLVTASDQEYRWATLNAGIPNDMFEPPFIVGEYLLRPLSSTPGARYVRAPGNPRFKFPWDRSIRAGWDSIDDSRVRSRRLPARPCSASRWYRSRTTSTGSGTRSLRR